MCNLPLGGGCRKKLLLKKYLSGKSVGEAFLAIERAPKPFLTLRPHFGDILLPKRLLKLPSNQTIKPALITEKEASKKVVLKREKN